jgi:hypothetical protein
MIDMVPKAISLTLVNHSKENLQRELLQELYKPDVLEDLLKESELIVARRKEVVGMVQALNKAEECVPIICLCMFLVANLPRMFSQLGLWRASDCGWDFGTSGLHYGRMLLLFPFPLSFFSFLSLPSLSKCDYTNNTLAGHAFCPALSVAASDECVGGTAARSSRLALSARS